jgi:peptide/nickel transport system ATP-binding protein
VQAQILALLGRLQRELEMAIIIITHDLGVVAEVADQIAVMYAGRIVESASTAEIFRAPEHPYTWGLLRSIPSLDRDRGEDLVPVSGRPPSLIHRPSGCHFHPRCPYSQPEHTRIDPQLAPIPGRPDHAVACLLPAEARRQIWLELRRGQDAERAAQVAGLTISEVSSDADPVPTVGEVAAAADAGAGAPEEPPA